MKWMMVGTMIAAGSLATTAARAQEMNAGTGAPATGQSAKTVQSSPHRYGLYFNGPATPDANGVPVPNPNPYSRFEAEDEGDGLLIERPLVDPPTDNSGTEAETH